MAFLSKHVCAIEKKRTIRYFLTVSERKEFASREEENPQPDDLTGTIDTSASLTQRSSSCREDKQSGEQ
eukprot:6077505-Pleurochrysis_carterae.AAC.1